MHYTVQWAETLEELAKQVGYAMQSGYVPQGGIFVLRSEYENERKGYSESETIYYQAMIRKATIWERVRDAFKGA